jgi:hypothetical protein
METAASFEARKAPSSYPTILGEAMETSASFEARSAPLPYPTVVISVAGPPVDRPLAKRNLLAEMIVVRNADGRADEEPARVRGRHREHPFR